MSMRFSTIHNKTHIPHLAYPSLINPSPSRLQFNLFGANQQMDYATGEMVIDNVYAEYKNKTKI